MEEVVIGGLSVPKITGALVLLASLFDLQHSFRKTNSSIVLLIAAFITYAFISLFWSYDPAEGLVKLLTYLQTFIIGIIILNQLDSKKDLNTFFSCYSAGCLLAAANIIYNFKTGYAYQGSEIFEDISAVRYSAYEVDPNEIGMLLVIGITLIINGVRTKSPLQLAGILAVCFIITYGIILTASRTAFALLVLSLLAFVIRRGRNAGSYIGIAAGLGIVIGGLLYFNLIPLLTLERVLSVQSNVSAGSFSGREMAWKNLFSVFTDNSFFGVGLGGANEALRQGGMPVMSSHNTYVNILAQLGFIGFIPFILICIQSFRTFYRSRAVFRGLLIAYAIILVGIFTLTYDQKKLLWIIFIIAAILETKHLMFSHEDHPDSTQLQ
jgi:O-antigen ligase